MYHTYIEAKVKKKGISPPPLPYTLKCFSCIHQVCILFNGKIRSQNIGINTFTIVVTTHRYTNILERIIPNGNATIGIDNRIIGKGNKCFGCDDDISHGILLVGCVAWLDIEPKVKK